MRRNIEDHKEELARTITLDQGKTLEEARGEVLRATEFIETAIAAPMLYHSSSGNVAGPIDARHVREPLGVCVAITPLNFPVMNPSQFTAWALVTGNTLVLKDPSRIPSPPPRWSVSCRIPAFLTACSIWSTGGQTWHSG